MRFISEKQFWAEMAVAWVIWVAFIYIGVFEFGHMVWYSAGIVACRYFMGSREMSNDSTG